MNEEILPKIFPRRALDVKDWGPGIGAACTWVVQVAIVGSLTETGIDSHVPYECHHFNSRVQSSAPFSWFAGLEVGSSPDRPLLVAKC